MKEYLRWSLRQLYLIFFQPTQFEREVGDSESVSLKRTLAALEDSESVSLKRMLAARIRYLLKMLPWTIILAVLGNIVLGYASEAFGVTFNWRGAWLGVLLFGALCGLMGSVSAGVSAGVAGGVVFGVWFGETRDMWLGVALGIACGITSRLIVSADRYDAGNGVGVSLILGAAVGILATGLGGVLLGMALGVALILAFWLTHFRLITYPFDVALATATYYAARWRPHAAWRAWRWCPIAWNEVIWLPLPFVSKLLALLVKQDRKEGLKQIAFVATNRHLQYRAALVALEEVIINDLRAGSLPNLPDVMERLSWTMDAPVHLTNELTTALPHFDRAAQHVGQYLTLNSLYRKGEALARAMAETEALQRSLLVARGSRVFISLHSDDWLDHQSVDVGGRYVPQLLQVANEWHRLIDEESERAKALAAATREIPNPFVFGNPVMETEQNVFTGRRDMVRQIESSILGAMQTPTLLLHGPRRMGKTSILNQLPRLLGPDFAPTVVDCQNPAVTESAATLLRYLSRKLSEGLRRKRVAVEPLTAAALAREPFAVFDDWLEEVERVMPEGVRALLCLDEYERLQATLDAGWGGSFLDALRHMLQHRPRVVLMFTGAHTFQELGPAWTDRFISARRVRVSFLTRAEVLPLLTQPIPEFDMTYAAGALDALFAATTGQPFLTQAVAFELVQLLNEQQRREATPAEVEMALARALVSGGEYFANVWSDAGAEGQAILSAIVRGESPPDFPTARVWLREHDVLDATGAFAVPLVQRWVQEKIRG